MSRIFNSPTKIKNKKITLVRFIIRGAAQKKWENNRCPKTGLTIHNKSLWWNKRSAKQRSLIRVPVAQWIVRWTSNPEVAGSNPAEDETKFFLAHKESKIRKLQSGYIVILSTYLYLTKMKNKKLTFVHSINTAIPHEVQTITKALT